MKFKYIVIGTILLALVGFLLSKLLFHQPDKKTIIKTTSQTKSLPREVTIQLTKDGFSPSSVTVQVETAVRWKNQSGEKQTVNSDNYPTNQLHKELNFGVFANGSSVVYTFTKPGDYGYHNQLHPEQRGKIVVTK